MFYNIIENYLKNMTKNDVFLFASKNDINLNNLELDYIYNIIKNDYKELLSSNYNIIFENAKSVIRSDNLKKIYNLYIDYRSKYLHYLN